MNTPPIQVVESETPDALDPFDPARLRLSQSFAETIGVKKLLTTVPVGRPSAQSFFRTHPDPAYRCDLAVIDLRTDREVYLVTPEVLSELSDEIVPVKLVPRSSTARACSGSGPSGSPAPMARPTAGGDFGAGWCRGRPAEVGPRKGEHGPRRLRDPDRYCDHHGTEVAGAEHAGDPSDRLQGPSHRFARPSGRQASARRA